MSLIDRVEKLETAFLSSFFSGSAKRAGVFECLIFSLGGLMVSLFLIAHYVPMAVEFPIGP